MDRSFNPPPWKLDGDVIRDASGGVVISAINPCNTAVRKMIVESVNGSAHLRQALTKIRDLANRDTDESMLAVSTRNNLMGHIANFALKGIEP